MKRKRWTWVVPVLLGVLIAVMVGVAYSPVEADNDNPGVLPIGSNPFGKSYAEWGMVWSEWAFGIPGATNPILDTTGEFCGEDQSGKVWFLAGSFGDGTPDRDCDVPAGKAIFFPILNITCWAPEDGETVEDLIDCTTLLDLIESDFTLLMEASVDGVPIEGVDEYRSGLGFGTLVTPEGGLIEPAGVRPAVSDGWFLMLAPLSAGDHTISLRAEIVEFGLVFGANYTIHVAGGKP